LACFRADGQQILDLTGDRPQDDRFRLFGHDVSNLVKPVQLSLEVTLLEVWPLTVASLERVDVQLSLRNTGKDAITIPVSRSYSKTMEPGMRGRRVFYVGLMLNRPGDVSNKGLRYAFEGYVGSTSVPDSLITVAPGETFVVRATGQINEGAFDPPWRDRRIVPVTAKAFVSEHFVADDRDVMTSQTIDVFSNNSRNFTLIFPDIPK